MFFFRSVRFRLGIALLALALAVAGCAVSAKNSTYFGKTTPPRDKILRYTSGSEAESIDPQVGTSQSDARIHMALFEGLAEYDPKTMEPIPAIAESWDHNKDFTEFVFHLRKNARFSDGTPITAQDFVYTLRRGLSPELASRNAYLAYYIKYAQGYNSNGSFVRDPKTNQFLLEKDFETDEEKAANASSTQADEAKPSAVEGIIAVEGGDTSLDTQFHHLMHEPARVVLSGDDKERAAQFKANPKLKEAVEGKELVPVKAEDIGVEAPNDYTFRITLGQSAPFFIGLIPHQFFRVVPRKAIEQYKDTWTQDAHIICSGPFMLETWIPYDKIVVKRNPMYWEAGAVQLDKIIFYPVPDNVTMMNLYKSGEIDATPNHTVLKGWLDQIMPLKDYYKAPEASIEYYQFNCLKGPTANRLVRKALNMAIDKVEFAKWRKIVYPLTAFTPEGIFPGYPQPKGDEFNPEKARQLLAQAGYKDAKGNYDPSKFPVSEVELNYNPDGANPQVAEFVQAQWKQNLKITIPLKSMEFRTFLSVRAKGEFKGIARTGWIGDYIDPFTFLNLFTHGAENGTGWEDPKYDQMLREANRTLDPQKRYELLAKAEAYLLNDQPVIPLSTNTTNMMIKPYVKGLYPNPGTLHAWKFVSIEQDPSKWDSIRPVIEESSAGK